MNKRQLTFLTAVFSLVFLLGNCALVPGAEAKDEENTGTISVMLWNVENLFDAVDDGTEYDEYTSGGGWNEKKYQARVISISQAIESAFSAEYSVNSFDRNPPVLIGLVEVENLQVLEDLSRDSLAKYGYNWAFFGKLPGMSLGVGAISRLPLSETKVHSITALGETIPRPIIEVHLETDGEGIVFFICHWKSKLGGDEATESLRRASTRVINRRVKEIHEEEPDKAVVIMGDLNENHDEFYRFSGTVVSALLPDDPWAARLAVSENVWDFLLLSGEKPPRSKYFDDDLPVFYTPWGNELSDGSYYYRKDWETIDHFLLSAQFFNGKGWVFEDARVLARPPFISPSGYPVAYTPRNGSGLSDHLPLMLYLKRAEVDGE